MPFYSNIDILKANAGYESVPITDASFIENEAGIDLISVKEPIPETFFYDKYVMEESSGQYIIPKIPSTGTDVGSLTYIRLINDDVRIIVNVKAPISYMDIHVKILNNKERFTPYYARNIANRLLKFDKAIKVTADVSMDSERKFKENEYSRLSICNIRETLPVLAFAKATVGATVGPASYPTSNDRPFNTNVYSETVDILTTKIQRQQIPYSESDDPWALMLTLHFENITSSFGFSVKNVTIENVFEKNFGRLIYDSSFYDFIPRAIYPKAARDNLMKQWKTYSKAATNFVSTDHITDPDSVQIVFDRPTKNSKVCSYIEIQDISKYAQLVLSGVHGSFASNANAAKLNIGLTNNMNLITGTTAFPNATNATNQYFSLGTGNITDSKLGLTGFDVGDLTGKYYLYIGFESGYSQKRYVVFDKIEFK